MVFKSEKVKNSLSKKGFVWEPGDHNFYVLHVDGVRTHIRTKVSHCGRDINDYLIDKMKKQVCLSKNDFLDLINCPLSKEQYIEKMKINGHIVNT